MYITKDQDIITKTDYIIEEIKKQDPDVLMLQECSEYFISILTKQCMYKRHRHILTHGGLVVIFTKYDLNVTQDIIFSDIGVGIKVGNKTLVTCHLVPFVNNQEFRQGQLKEVMTKIKDNNVLIMGDMNMNNYQNFKSDTMNDVALLEKNYNDTWFLNYHDKTKTTSRRFDRVYTDIITTKYKTYPEYKFLSDHIPISIEFT
jgi:endonuclease/exonuclease/phosphatase family metal-dependent hydrolase